MFFEDLIVGYAPVGDLSPINLLNIVVTLTTFCSDVHLTVFPGIDINRVIS